MLVGLADRQHGQIHSRLLLQGGQQLIRGVTIRGRPKLGFDGLHGRRGGRQRRIEIGLQPCQGCRRPGLPVHQVQVRIRRSWLELHAQPARVLQPAADLGRDVLAIRHGGVVAEREVDTALPGHLRAWPFRRAGMQRYAQPHRSERWNRTYGPLAGQPLSPAATPCSTACARSATIRVAAPARRPARSR